MLLVEAHDTFHNAVGDEHPKTARTKAWLAAARAGLGRDEEATRMLEATLEVQRKRLPAGHPHLTETMDLVKEVL